MNTQLLPSRTPQDEWWYQVRRASLAYRTPRGMPLLHTVRDGRSATHFVQYAYSRLITVTVCARTSPSDVVRHIAAMEHNEVSDYRWLRMECAENNG